MVIAAIFVLGGGGHINMLNQYFENSIVTLIIAQVLCRGVYQVCKKSRNIALVNDLLSGIVVAVCGALVPKAVATFISSSSQLYCTGKQKAYWGPGDEAKLTVGMCKHSMAYMAFLNIHSFSPFPLGVCFLRIKWKENVVAANSKMYQEWWGLGTTLQKQTPNSQMVKPLSAHVCKYCGYMLNTDYIWLPKSGS